MSYRFEQIITHVVLHLNQDHKDTKTQKQLGNSSSNVPLCENVTEFPVCECASVCLCVGVSTLVYGVSVHVELFRGDG